MTIDKHEYKTNKNEEKNCRNKSEKEIYQSERKRRQMKYIKEKKLKRKMSEQQ